MSQTPALGANWAPARLANRGLRAYSGSGSGLGCTGRASDKRRTQGILRRNTAQRPYLRVCGSGGGCQGTAERRDNLEELRERTKPGRSARGLALLPRKIDLEGGNEPCRGHRTSSGGIGKPRVQSHAGGRKLSRRWRDFQVSLLSPSSPSNSLANLRRAA